MDIGRFLEIAANYVEIAFEKHLSLSVTLIAAGAIVAAAFLMLSMRILTSAKRRYSKRANKIAKYFERKYVGTYYDAEKFYRARRHAMTRKARDEWKGFMSGDMPLDKTAFYALQTEKGRGGLNAVTGVFTLFAVIATALLAAKCFISEIYGIEAAVYIAVPIIIMFALRGVLAIAVNSVNKKYVKSLKRLKKAVKDVSYNNEALSFVKYERRPINVTLEKEDKSGVKAQDVIETIEKSGVTSKTKEMISECIGDVKDYLRDEDRIKYEEFLAKVGGEG
jgi:hypothetical protein